MIWNALAPKLCGRFRTCRVVKVAEDQRRGVVHLHAIVRIDAACSACPTGTPGVTGSTSDETWGLSSGELTTHADRPSMLVVSQAWSRGWQATVDGRAAPVVRVDGLVQGAPVPAGTHRVVLTYHAPGLQLGFAVTVAVLLGLLVPAVAGAVWRRRRPVGTSAG